MKIVVFYAGQYSGWRWRIEGSNGVKIYHAVSSRSYTRKSDAKRGAERFEEKLLEVYMNSQDPQIYIEVLD